MRTLIFLGSLFLVGFTTEPTDDFSQFTAKVVGVTDGDTIKVLKDRQQITIRLERIDAPEKTQAFGSKAKSALSDLVYGKTVNVLTSSEDRYGRTLARVFINDKDVSESMLIQGMAWHYKEYSDDAALAKLEDDARTSKIGLWADKDAVPPWAFRKTRKQDTEPKKPPVVRPPLNSSENNPPSQGEGYWLNTSSNVRHNSSCKWFNNTKSGRSCGANDGKGCGICGG